MVFGSESECHADRGGFLANGKMGRPGMMVREASVCAPELGFVEDGFEFADGAHIAPDAQEVIRREKLQLFGDRLLVGVNRNIGEMDRAPGERRGRIYDDRFRHSYRTLLRAPRSLGPRFDNGVVIYW